MDPQRLTQKTQEALHDAQTKALRYGHTEVDAEHLLLALLEQPDGLAARWWTVRRSTPRAARRAASSSSSGARASRARAPPATRRISRALGQPLDAAEQRGRAA